MKLLPNFNTGEKDAFEGYLSFQVKLCNGKPKIRIRLTRKGICDMSKTISLDQLPPQVESLLRVAWEVHESIVLEHEGEPVAVVLPIEEYIRLHPDINKLGSKAR